MSRFFNYIDGCAVAASDCVATIVALILVSLLAIWLGACAEVGRFSADDAQRAAAIATVVGDPVDATCWPVLETTGEAISAEGGKPGIFTGIEEKRAVQKALENTICQPIWADAMAGLLKASPAAPFIP